MFIVHWINQADLAPSKSDYNRKAVGAMGRTYRYYLFLVYRINQVDLSRSKPDFKRRKLGQSAHLKG
jgi:hypothetical protein